MIRVALAGNPNCGKTTLFNALTGATAHVGNWPGVTVDKREGVCKKGSEPFVVVDLPGIYSLSPYTPEEVIARNFILDNKPDCVIDIVDSTNLERNLYLTTQLMEMDVPIVVALNMADELEKNGDKIDVKLLEERLDMPVVSVSAVTGKGIKELIDRTIAAAKRKRQGVSVLGSTMLAPAIEEAAVRMRDDGVSSPLFHAIKLTEGDSLESENHKKTAAFVNNYTRGMKDATFGNDWEAFFANARYDYITANYSPALTRKSGEGKRLKMSEKIDRVLTNKWAGIPLFVVILFVIFHLTFSENLLFLAPALGAGGDWTMFEGTPFEGLFGSSAGISSPGVILQKFIEGITGAISGGIGEGMAAAGAADWAQGFVVDGVLGGLFAVIGFLPQILVLFLFFSLLEDSGYMARVAFILDRLFRKLGLSGRALMPMIMGFGCSVPAMINTRTLADEEERTATVRVIPFFSCGAKLPILVGCAGALVTASGFGNADVITMLMYLLGMCVALVSVILMRSTTMRGELSPFIMELPNYRRPGFRSTMLHLWDKAKHFIKKAFTIILASTIIIWFFSHFTWDWGFVSDEDMGSSILASLGKLIQPLFTPVGFGAQLGAVGWVFAVAAITGLIAKENVIATFGTLAAAVVAGFDLEAAGEDGIAAIDALMGVTGISGVGLISFIAFNMLTIPCFAAVATARGELTKKRFRWTLLFWLGSSYLVSSMIYTIGEFIWPVAVWAAAWAIAIAVIVIINKRLKAKEEQKKIKTA